MAPGREVASVVIDDLRRLGTCTPEELAQRLPGYSWNQVFAAVDQLCREGRLTLRHPSRFRYVISLPTTAQAERRAPTP